MATQYAFKAVDSSWQDIEYWAGAHAPPGVQSPQVFTIGDDLGLYTVARPAQWQATIEDRLGHDVSSDALTAVVAFSYPDWPWQLVHWGIGPSGGVTTAWPPGSGHLVRLTYDDGTDLVATTDVAGGAPEIGGNPVVTLLLRACHADAEMTLGSGGFVVV